MGHKNTQQLLSELGSLKKIINVGDRFSHYKHPESFYTVVAIGFIEVSEEVCVVYKAEYGDEFTWVRTQSEFFSKAKLEDGTEVDRFTKVV